MYAFFSCLSHLLLRHKKSALCLKVTGLLWIVCFPTFICFIVWYWMGYVAVSPSQRRLTFHIICPSPSLFIPKDATLEIERKNEASVTQLHESREAARLMPFLCSCVFACGVCFTTQGCIVASGCVRDSNTARTECCFLASRISVSSSYIPIIC
jgi:hypothetical protein